MIVDSSVMVAIALKEPGHEIYPVQIENAGRVQMSAASFLETCVVVNARLGETGISALRQLLSDSNIEIVPFSQADAEIAFDAYRRFGKGQGHPAQLNILDTCSYALAARLSQPLLFKGNDFAKTGIPAA
jgi:ribonuclease VapC